MRSRCLKFSFVAFMITMAFVIKVPLMAMDVNEKMEDKKYHPKLESVLGELAEKYFQSRTDMQSFAQLRSIPVEDDQVRLILVPLLGEEASTINQASLVSFGAVIEATSKHLMRVRAPISRLEEIANRVKGISFIRLPYRPVLMTMEEEEVGAILSSSNKIKPDIMGNILGVVSEGVKLVGALDYHDSGYKGQGTRIAVIDIGFANLYDSIVHGDLPKNVLHRNFTNTKFESGRSHGTGVAEIVHDMAPEARLYLAKIEDELDLENAKDKALGHDNINVISHSWGWPGTNFGDGTGFVSEIANDARAKGILWVNAAGNLADSHYQAFFTDTDNDSWHDFSTNPRDERNAFEYSHNEYIPLAVQLTWDSWPVTDQDYDLYLYDSNLNLVASSTTRQTGTQPPAEQITLDNAQSGTYYLGIRKYSATGDQELMVFAGSLQYQTAQHSLWPPADATGVVAVGYINKENWLSGPQGFRSSQGSTNDGRIKPDIMGPANVASFTWGIGNYTSAATPHVSGAAALILSLSPSSTADQLQSALESWAVDMGTSGKDNIYGFGRLRLLLPPVLSWTGEANYESDGLNPERGNTSTSFVYRTKYVDEYNYAPKSGYPKVYILQNGSEMAGSPFTMSEVDPGDTTFRDGKLYTYTKAGLAAGTGHSYYFEAYDAHYGVLAIGDPTSERTGPSIVFPVNLENLIVYPNPFNRLVGHQEISFHRLTIDVKIRVFSLTGELVKEEGVSWQYDWTWDVRNMNGEQLARGVYLWIVTNSAGERKTGKIAIIK